MTDHFQKFREGIIGIDTQIDCPDGKSRPIIYADWVASGRLYGPIEDRLRETIMPLVANTHTETSTTGMAMTHAYHTAQRRIKDHVNANKRDIIITRSSGMTGLVNKFQRMLGLKANQDLNLTPPGRGMSGCFYHPYGTSLQPYKLVGNHGYRRDYPTNRGWTGRSLFPGKTPQKISGPSH